MKLLTTIGLLALLASSCSNNVEDPGPCTVPETPQYFNDIYPIIDRTCAIPACHVNGSQFGNFKNTEEVKKVADNGRLEFMIVTKQMPAGTTKGAAFLTDCEINLIRKWIKTGAPMN